MAVAHMLTKNNSKTIQKTLESISFADEILVADLGSSDNTVSICESRGAIVEKFDRPRNEARNALIAQGSEGWNFMIEPWEVITHGHKAIEKCSGAIAYGTILQNKSISKELRFWEGKGWAFHNPVFERLNGATEREVPTVFYSLGSPDYDEALNIIREWKGHKPTSIRPWYYHACVLLAQGKWKEFIPVSEHYMALDRSISMSTIMNRYYYAMASLVYFKEVRPALQNLTLCLSERPLMAEFWCLMGDVFYHLSKDFKRAQEFYENAIKLGSKRLKTDKWPMDITKYKSYPEKMIESCKKIKGHSFYSPI